MSLAWRWRPSFRINLRDDGLLIINGVEADGVSPPSAVNVKAIAIAILIVEVVTPGHVAGNRQSVVVVPRMVPAELVLSDIDLVFDLLGGAVVDPIMIRPVDVDMVLVWRPILLDVMVASRARLDIRRVRIRILEALYDFLGLLEVSVSGYFIADAVFSSVSVRKLPPYCATFVKGSSYDGYASCKLFGGI